MIRCNNCAIDECTSYKSLKFANNCTLFRRLQPRKVPILLNLLNDDNKVDDVVNVLSKFNINIIETNEYPFFKLNHK